MLKGMISLLPSSRKWGGNMRKSYLLVRSNLRRAKGQTAAIVVLILIASLMLNLWLMLAVDYKRNFDRCHEKLNAEHVTLVLGSDDPEMRAFVSEKLEAEERTTQFCISDVLSCAGSFDYSGGEINSNFVILEKEAAFSRAVGKIEIVEDSNFTSGIYLPMLYATDGSYSVGDTIEVRLGLDTESYTICGFYNSVMAGSHNCGVCSLVLTRDKYEKLEEKSFIPQSTLCSVRISDKEESEDFEAMLKNAVSGQYPSVNTSSNSYSLVSSSRYISQMVCSGLVSTMAFLVTLIAMVVIFSNVADYIQKNMKNIGALKAIGYTSRQLIRALLLQFSGIALITSLFGIGISYCLFPAVNSMMTSQTGIPYTMRFLPFPFIAAIALMDGGIAFAVWLSSRRIKKIEPITALRQGVQTHNFKRNHIPLEKTSIPLNTALALKATFSGLRQNITVCITMLVLSLILVFSGLMRENFIVNMQPFIDLIVGETADSCINVDPEIENQFLQEMRQDQRVEKVYLFHLAEVRHVGGVVLPVTLSDDFSKLNNQDICFEGRFPEYDNEMAIAAKYAKDQGLAIGDEIILTVDGNEASYIITGFTQMSNYLGKDCLMLRSGYERMGELQNAGYYLNLADGVEIDGFHEEISERFTGGINAVANILAATMGTGSVYVSLMTIIVTAILVLSVIVIAFVLYLLVRTTLNSKKRDYGIMKAYGFTTGQLILQTALSFMPSIILSTAAGIAVSSLVINPLLAVFLSGIGIVKCTFSIPAGGTAAAGMGMIVLAFVIVCLLSLKIKKIAPVALLAEE